jgi:DNA-directed RNA polymerase specialized sigma24 family protein
MTHRCAISNPSGRHFGRLTIEETAAVLGISPATVKREWVVARAWLRRELSEEGSP